MTLSEIESAKHDEYYWFLNESTAQKDLCKMVDDPEGYYHRRVWAVNRSIFWVMWQ